MKSLQAVTLGLVMAVALVLGCAESQKKTAGLPDGHPKFETLCSKCHTLDRVEAAHNSMTEEEMQKLASRMAQKPGSGIDLHDINDIVREMY